ncbi:MAG: hypothetical protein B7Z06_06735 [Flavobacteriales bacterium 32-35-8]|jgi:hypothetical protein|nr:MAG: hypothetical protein B7Z06_06735 [Flavobacteriales bacterium 32-35-8]
MLSYKTECCYFADKKRYSGDCSGREAKLLVKYKIIGSGTKCKYFFLFGGLDSHFLLGMQCSFPAKRKGVTEWKVKSGDCVQDLC